MDTPHGYEVWIYRDAVLFIGQLRDGAACADIQTLLRYVDGVSIIVMVYLNMFY